MQLPEMNETFWQKLSLFERVIYKLRLPVLNETHTDSYTGRRLGSFYNMFYLFIYVLLYIIFYLSKHRTDHGSNRGGGGVAALSSSSGESENIPRKVNNPTYTV
jgi:hypothetical protein